MIDNEPERRSLYRRPLPGPHSEQDVLDALAWYEGADAYDRERNARETTVRQPVDDDGEHGASDSLQRWERDREAGIDA